MGTVFITDGLLRKSLAMTRSLGGKGIDVMVGDKTRWTISHFSKYARFKTCYPDPKTKPEQFVTWVNTHLKTGAWEVFIPMDDPVMDLAIQYREEWEKHCQIVLPPTPSYYQLRDKYRAVQLAKKAGLRCPATYAPKTMDDVKRLSEKIPYPVVVKPRFESGSRGIKIIHSRADLLEHYKYQESFPMIQEYIPQGFRYDVGLLLDFQHEVKASFVQKEVRHFPVKMGPSTVQMSMYDDDLLQKSLSLMSLIPWTGIVEIEFMIDSRTNQPVFMEANPRFWNSLACAIQSDVNFPILLYELAIHGEVRSVARYRQNVYCRNLFPGDLLHFLTNPKRKNMEPPLLTWGARTYTDDILSKSDPLPFIGFLLTCLRYLFSRSAWKELVKRS